MKRGRTADQRAAFDGRAEAKVLLKLYASTNLDSFWIAIRKAVIAAIGQCALALSLEEGAAAATAPERKMQIPGSIFQEPGFAAYFRTHPGCHVARINDVFGSRSSLNRSRFYREHMVPHRFAHALGLFFWTNSRLTCAMAIMRTNTQGAFSDVEMKSLRRLYPQISASLRGLRAREREHIARVVFEQFLGQLPLPTLLLRWNLTIAYSNQAAREFCALWEHGPATARLFKTGGAIPAELLQTCSVLQKRWRETLHLPAPREFLKAIVIHNPRQPHLRATLTLKQPAATGFCRPHFLIECEELSQPGQFSARAANRLPHFARLTKREQQVTRLVCGGQSNQEVGDEAGLSLQMVKKHLHSIFGKLEVTSRSRLMVLMR